jgi:hypothetical protein
VDDREQNLAPTCRLGMQTLHVTGPASLEAGLRERRLL